jgi:hypothetical protein
MNLATSIRIQPTKIIADLYQKTIRLSNIGLSIIGTRTNNRCMHNSACFFPVFFRTNFSVAGVASLLLHAPQLLFSSCNVAGDPAFTGVLAAVYVSDVPVVSEAAVVPAFSHFLNRCIESLLLLLQYSG